MLRAGAGAGAAGDACLASTAGAGARPGAGAKAGAGMWAGFTATLRIYVCTGTARAGTATF